MPSLASPPLRLEGYVVGSCSFVCRWQSAQAQALIGSPMSTVAPERLAITSTIGQNQTDPALWHIELSITLKESAGCPWSCAVCIQGFFTLDPNFMKTDRYWDHFYQSGASILYSSARDYIQTLTSRTPIGRLFLPTIQFPLDSGLRSPDDLKPPVANQHDQPAAAHHPQKQPTAKKKARAVPRKSP